MKLSDLERRMLAAMELRAIASPEEIQQRTGIGINSIRYAQKKLEARGIIHSVPFIDLYPLGYTDFVLFFSIASPDHPGEREKFLRMLEASPLVTWIGELGGQFQYGAAIFVKNVAEFLAFLENINGHFSGMVMKKAVRLTKRLTRYNRTYLCPDIPKESFVFGAQDHTTTLDERDEAILGALTNHPGQSARRTAESLHMPLSTFQHRVRQLEEKGILVGHLLVIDTARLGATLYNLHLFVNGLHAAFEQKLRAWAATHPNVVHLIDCVGEWDYEVGVEVEASQDITRIVTELYDQFGQTITRIDTIPIFRNRKYIFFRPTRTTST